MSVWFNSFNPNTQQDANMHDVEEEIQKINKLINRLEKYSSVESITAAVTARLKLLELQTVKKFGIDSELAELLKKGYEE